MIQDVTVRFCERYVDRKSRTCDQMEQAARSGKQNIIEGSQASGTSKKMELKLTNTARASQEELRHDFEDILRQRGLPQWDRDDPRRVALIDRRPQTLDDFAQWVKDVREGRISGPGGRSGQRPGPGKRMRGASTGSTQSTGSTKAGYLEISANGALALINVVCFLLDRQLAALAKDFKEDGGFTERLYRVRRRYRSDRDQRPET